MVKITRKQIQARAGSKSFSRGEKYYNGGAISHTIRREQTIEARCRGSYPDPYRVQATLNDSGIVWTACSCPYDWGGDCKHIIAMLLTYADNPEFFAERPPLKDALMSRDKEDLIEVIMTMVTRYPDLQEIVDSPTANEIIKGKISFDTSKIRQQLQDDFQTYGYEYDYYYDDGMSRHSGGTVPDVIQLGKRFAERGDWKNASLAYCTILEEFANLSEDEYHDEEGELAIQIDNTVTLLEDCLQQDEIINDEHERRTILFAMLGVYLWDIEQGGYDIGSDAPDIILKYIKRDDIAEIRKTVKTIRDNRLKRRHSKWRAEAYNALLADLDTLDEVDPEIILARLGEQGMYSLLVTKLLELKRSDEAATIIRKHLPGRFERINALSQFMSQGHNDLALQIAEEGLAGNFDEHFAYWLADRYENAGNQERELHWRQVLMTKQPYLKNYSSLKSIAEKMNRWQELQPDVIKELRAQGDFGTLTRIHLLDEEWALAWEALEKVNRKDSRYFMRSLDLEVAEKSRHDMPERAIPVYINYARRFIDSRGRGNYQEAASLLSIVQGLYDRIGEFEQWETLIADIRSEYKKLPALKDELNKAGL